MENLAEKGNKQKGDVKLAERGIGKLREKKKKAKKGGGKSVRFEGVIGFPFCRVFHFFCFMT